MTSDGRATSVVFGDRNLLLFYAWRTKKVICGELYDGLAQNCALRSCREISGISQGQTLVESLTRKIQVVVIVPEFLSLQTLSFM